MFLTQLCCSNNQIGTLDFKDCRDLRVLICNSNYLVNLDLSNSESLTVVSCLNNPIETISVCGKIPEFYYPETATLE